MFFLFQIEDTLANMQALSTLKSCITTACCPSSGSLVSKLLNSIPVFQLISFIDSAGLKINCKSAKCPRLQVYTEN